MWDRMILQVRLLEEDAEREFGVRCLVGPTPLKGRWGGRIGLQKKSKCNVAHQVWSPGEKMTSHGPWLRLTMLGLPLPTPCSDAGCDADY